MDPKAARHEYDLTLVPFNKLKKADAVVVAVAHRDYRAITPNQFLSLMGKKPVLIDVKGIYDAAALRRAGVRFWRL